MENKTTDNHKNISDASSTNVHFFDYVNSRWNGGKRLSISIRQNEKLYKEFKPLAQRLYGSVCKAIEAFEASVVLANDQKVHFSHTLANVKPINIGKIVIERNLSRERRNLEIEPNVDALTGNNMSQVRGFKLGKSVKRVDYDGLSDEDLLKRYKLAKTRGDQATVQLCAFHIKKRGLKP